MKFKSYAKNEKTNLEIPVFLKISRDTSLTNIEPGSPELNPSFKLLLYQGG